MSYFLRLVKFGLRFLVKLGFILGLVTLAIAPSASAAALCYTTTEHQICILDVRRSAKNYWEYRAIVQVDAEIRPVEVYNCRDRSRTRSDGKIVPFEPSGVGPLICRTLNRS